MNDNHNVSNYTHHYDYEKWQVIFNYYYCISIAINIHIVFILLHLFLVLL